MRLEKIELNGFKSFADKTELNFNFPITAIVGPNGCGKSNVVDAVKWVLGEQSVKSLRSGHMADVIFSGSSSRKAMASAEVGLFFSNTAGALPIEAENVQITRRIYRSGESEYLINNNICRLRDIKEMFMDTGVGAKAYSIIEQGQINQLLNASKIDRRNIFEEAAGISKYKAHKKEALRKLERTEQNLLRLADILQEVEKSLRSVKHQAGKARSYLKYTERLRELQVNYSLVEYAKLERSISEKKEELSRVQRHFGEVASELAKNDALMSSISELAIETENRINKTDNSFVSIKSKIEQHQQRIEFLRSRINELGERKQNALVRVEKARQSQELVIEDLVRYKKEKTDCDKLLHEKTSELGRLQEKISVIAAECSELEAKLEDEKSGVIDIVRRTAQLHNELQSLSDHRQSLSSQKDRLSSRADIAKQQLEKILTEKAQYQARAADVEKNITELNDSLEIQKKKAQKVSELIEADARRLAQAKETRSALTSEINILSDMENRREGLAATVKSILEGRNKENSFSYVEGLVADAIIADVKYAAAVEACLEGKTDSIVVGDSSTLLADSDTIDKLDGRVNFICTDRVEKFSESIDLSKYPEIKGRLAEFVSFESRFAPLAWSLLGKSLLVDSIDSALKLAGELPAEYEFVTLKGELLGRDGTIKLGPVGKAGGLISRKSRLRQLQEIINNTESEIITLQQQIANNSQSKEHLEKLRKELRTAIYESSTEKTEVTSRISFLEQDIKRLQEEQPLINGEIEMLEEQIAQSVKRQYHSKQNLEELEKVNNQRTEEIERLEREFEEKKILLQQQNENLIELKISVGQINQQLKGLDQNIDSLQKQIQSNESSEGAAKTEIQTCIEQAETAKKDILNSESAVSQLYIEKEQTQQDSRRLHGEVEELLAKQKHTEEIVRQKRSEQSEIEEQMSELKVALGQLEVKQQDLVERVLDELKLDLAEEFRNYQQSRPVGIDWEAVREEITELRSKIDRLGNVNLDAISEQENLEQRQEFLSSQVQDLNSSKGQLQQLINRLNKKSREKFQQTFEEIRTNFQQIFRKLFSGGKADIILEEAEDILDAGIEIIAKPPGKETRSISLLSGGEKSMTAIALLFAVFKSKPSPFCFLDEVDAALDEANNERFNMMIREFQKDSQFIVITHAKRTMSIADMLYGITMQTKGVSKKISVQFDQYEPEEQAAVA
ncbi:MAG: chromosome segregation protein SMC [Sedimentisphaerales bacterium]|nr:chromosome segregation protein SMC [Sedimentisphaerales bacterium]